MRLFVPNNAAHLRRGFTTPLVAVALLVGMAGMALVLDRLWLETTRVELQTAAEAAALAAARELTGDDLLIHPVAPSPENRGDSEAGDTNETSDPWAEQRAARARLAAAATALENRAAGQPVYIPADSRADVQLGRLVHDDTGEILFEHDEQRPTTVHVIAARRRSQSNPVGLFMGQLTGVAFADVVAEAEATIDPHVIGVRPLPGSAVPGLPLALLQHDPAGKRQDTWQAAIEDKRGSDEYSYDAVGHAVLKSSDGLPELVVKFPGRKSPQPINGLLIDLGTEFDEQLLERQFTSGWFQEDLGDVGTVFGPTQSAPVPVRGLAQLSGNDVSELEALIGQARLVPLYDNAVSVPKGSTYETNLVALVAVRILAVRNGEAGLHELVLQPTVIATRCAVLAGEDAVATTTDVLKETQSVLHGDEGGHLVDPHKYLYRLQLTY